MRKVRTPGVKAAGFVHQLLAKYENFRPFTYDEAWMLFKLAAIAEAVGWTLLISGILISKYLTPGNDFAVQFAGRLHGMLFMIYITGVVVFSPSQKWSKRRILIAGLASVPPYGSLAFEQWAANKRRKHSLRPDERGKGAERELKKEAGTA